MTKRVQKIIVAIAALLAVAVAILMMPPLVEEQLLLWRLDSEEDARWREAAEKLVEKGRRRGLARAIEVALRRDPDKFVADWQKRLFRLPANKVEWGLPGYGAALQCERAEVRRTAIYALSQWSLPGAVPILVKALESSDAVDRWQAAYALRGKWRSSMAMPSELV